VSAVYSHVAVDVEDQLATVVLARPDAGNALTPELLAEAHDALAAIAADRSIRALVLTGAGKAFSTGGDLSVIRATLEGNGDPQLAVDRSLGMLGEVVLLLRRMPQPSVAAVNGQAAGAGFSLALACDLRIGSRAAAFNFAYGALGASPDGGMTWFLPRLVTPARAAELLMDQPILRADAALAEGLLSEVVEREDLLDAARKRARRLAAKAPHAIYTARALVESSLDLPLAQQLDRERELFAEAVRSADFRNALAAALNGRRPTFAGR
jgi:enoyl-CoA hydratase/carnithine racemase